MEFINTLGKEVIAVIVAALIAVITPFVIRWRRKAKNRINKWK